jgi:hypothetical protein
MPGPEKKMGALALRLALPPISLRLLLLPAAWPLAAVMEKGVV